MPKVKYLLLFSALLVSRHLGRDVIPASFYYGLISNSINFLGMPANDGLGFSSGCGKK